MADLNPRQLAFTREYTKDHNGTQAAIRAGYGATNAAVTAARLLTQDKIRSAIAERESNMADELGLTAQYALEQLGQLINTAMSPVPKVDKDGKPIEVDGQRITEIDGGVAHRALELLMKHRGMLTDRAEFTVDGGVEFVLTLDRDLTPTPEQPAEETP